MNVQYAIKDGDIYVLEVNPRASRTVPFVAKVIGLPVAKIAARIMAGESLASFNLAPQRFEPGAMHHVGVKEAVFPFARFGDRRRYRARPRDEIDRRSHGPRPLLRHRLRQEPARRRHPRTASGAPYSSQSGTRTSRASWRRSAPRRPWLQDHRRPRAPSASLCEHGVGRRPHPQGARKAGRNIVDAIKNGGFSLSSTPPRGRRRWPIAVPCAALPSCIKCRTTPLFQGPSPRRRELKPISGATSRYVRCRAISAAALRPGNRHQRPGG